MSRHGLFDSTLYSFTLCFRGSEQLGIQGLAWNWEHLLVSGFGPTSMCLCSLGKRNSNRKSLCDACLSQCRLFFFFTYTSWPWQLVYLCLCHKLKFSDFGALSGCLFRDFVWLLASHAPCRTKVGRPFTVSLRLHWTKKKVLCVLDRFATSADYLPNEKCGCPVPLPRVTHGGIMHMWPLARAFTH